MFRMEQENPSNNMSLNQQERFVEDNRCIATDDPVLIQKARRLMAKEYLRHNFITANDIDENGVLTEASDPYGEHSTYFVVTANNGQDVAATARTIHYNYAMGEKSFPLFKYKSALETEAMDELGVIGYENLIEVSALVRDKALSKDNTAAMKLYKTMFQHTCYGDDSGKATWIMACSPVLYDNFKLLFGDSMNRIGPDLPYPGQPAIPAMFPIKDGAEHIIDISRDRHNKYAGVQRGLTNYFLIGADSSRLYDDTLQALDKFGYDKLRARLAIGSWGDIDKSERNALRTIKAGAVIGKGREMIRQYRPELVATAGLLGYTAIRTGIVADGISSVSNVDWRIFLGIELATTPPYVWGIGDLAKNATNEEYSTKRKIGAYALTSSAFTAPYAYLAAEGAAQSHQGLIVAGGLIVLAAIPAAVKAIKRKFTKKSQTSNLNGNGNV